MRKSWDDYFMDIARMVATRSTCDRAHVGCVIVRDHRIIATGYNGSLPGHPHCDDVGHDITNGHCVRTIHAEANAILESNERSHGATAYCTHYPCLACAKLLLRAGIIQVVYDHAYHLDPRACGLLVSVVTRSLHDPR